MFVNAIMYYKVKNPIHAVANVDDYGASARLLAATTLRNVLGTLNLGDILSQRETIAREMQVLKLCCLSQEAKSFLVASNLNFPGNIGRGHSLLGSHGGEGGGEGREGAGAAAAGDGC